MTANERSTEARLHVCGRSLFIDDHPEPPGTLHAMALTSPVAHGTITLLDTGPATAMDGVVRVLTAADIPGENQIGNIILDETLLAEEQVHFLGQPIVLVVAETRQLARDAAARIRLEIEELPAVFDPRQAAAAGQLIAPSRTFTIGDVDAAWQQCTTIVEGVVSSGAQEHLYLETQGALAIPGEQRTLKLLSATQAPTVVQRITARVLGLPMSAVEVEVRRLGGAFGGKEDQATPWAVMAALATHLLERPVKIVLNRQEDLRFTGKRHPYSSDFKLGLDDAGRMLAYEVSFYQSSGAAADLSPAILERSLFHTTNAYHIPNVRVTALPCRTNLPPFTAMRGFGAPQALLVIESAILEAARALGVEPHQLQQKNLLEDGDQLPYGMHVEHSRARRSFTEAVERFDLAGLREEIRSYNAGNRSCKRGLSLMPICFGISFTNTWLNQAGALVHVYTDGSVLVTTGAVEMGQGVSVKLMAIAAATLGISPERISLASTSTSRVANTSPTAASTGADMNGMATRLACLEILGRLRSTAAEELGCSADAVTISDGRVLVRGTASELRWERLVWLAYTQRVNLSAQAHYATPNIYFDRRTEKGKPFAYHVFGTAISEVTVDGVRGTYRVDRVRIVHDGGRSLAPLVDRGQLEGGLLQGIGWVTMEEIIYNDDGRLVTDTLSTYKVPDIHAAPEVESHFLEDADNPHAVLSSKAIGEPPFLYGIGTYLALQHAIQAFRPQQPLRHSSPLTPEKVLLLLHSDTAESAKD